MLNLNDTEKHYIEIAKHINLDDIDYLANMRLRSRHTYTSLGLAGSFFIVGLVFFVAELLPKVKGIGGAGVGILFFIALGFVFHALRYQKEIETRVTYDILQKIQAIEGNLGLLWRFNSLINAFCQDEYGGLPEAVQQLQTSSQAGGIEMGEIRLYKDLLERVLNWYSAHEKEFH